MIQSVEKVYYRKKLHKIKVYVHAFQRVAGVNGAEPPCRFRRSEIP